MKNSDLYWNALVSWRYELFCIEEMLRKNVMIARALKITLLCISLLALVAWVIWNEFPRVWSGIIAVSFMVSVAYERLPHSRGVDTLGYMANSLDKLYVKAEEFWWLLRVEDVSDSDIIAKRNWVSEEWHQVCRAGLTSHYARLSEAEKARISVDTDLYFKNMCGDGNG